MRDNVNDERKEYFKKEDHTQKKTNLENLDDN